MNLSSRLAKRQPRQLWPSSAGQMNEVGRRSPKARGHEDERIERVLERRPDYLMVEKAGEAREQIDRDHPRPRHQT